MGKQGSKPGEGQKRGGRGSVHSAKTRRGRTPHNADTKWRLALVAKDGGRPRWNGVAPGTPDPTHALIIADSTDTHRYRVRELPKGAILANQDRQNWGTYGPPMPAYVDIHYTCIDCQGPGLFSAKAQKFWYEDLGKTINSGAVRCQNCRKHWRAQRAANTQLGDALRAYQVEPSVHAALQVAQLTADAGPMMGAKARSRGLALARAAAKGGLDATALIATFTSSLTDATKT
jgi:hypothetical protein